MAQAVKVVADSMSRRRHIQLVIDPVLVATCGDSLASSEVGAAIAEQ